MELVDLHFGFKPEVGFVYISHFHAPFRSCFECQQTQLFVLPNSLCKKLPELNFLEPKRGCMAIYVMGIEGGE